MSINLTCKEVELWQTPTWVTDMCVSVSRPPTKKPDGRWRFASSDGGWRGVLFRYTCWVKARTEGAWANREDLEGMRDAVNRHLAELAKAVKKHKKLTFSYI